MSIDNLRRRGAALDRIETGLWSGRLDRRSFIQMAAAAGLSLTAARALAQEAEQIRQNQAALRRDLKPSYDYIVCGAGSSGSVVARRLAESPDVQVLLLEAGGTDDSPSILAPLQWYLNVQSERDWGYLTEPSAALNGRSIAMPMGKALGGGSSINAMVWAPATRTISTAGRRWRTIRCGATTTSSRSTGASRTGRALRTLPAAARAASSG